MCSSTETNKWAPRLVIILQLATWSVVGIVLLQRGATSLRGRPEDQRSAAQIQVALAGEAGFRKAKECGEEAARIGLPHSTRDDREAEPSRIPRHRKEEVGVPQNSLQPEVNYGEGQEVQIFSEASTLRSTESCTSRARTANQVERISGKNLRKKMRAARERERALQDRLLESNENGGQALRDDTLIQDYATGVTPLDPDFSIEDDEGSAAKRRNDSISSQEVSSGEVEEGVASSSRGEAPRLKPVDRAGAAAAVAMLAIGVVMLLLGPAIVILRAVEARRRERRFPKSRARKDLPPTYEEATLMDEAPRYSTLHLNTINDPSLNAALASSSVRS